MTEKEEEGQPTRIKARWCLRGHLDPDLSELIREGKLQSPTITPFGRAVCLQMVASHQWDLQFGDVYCVSPEAKNIQRRGPLLTTLPKGVPGHPEGEILEVTGNLCGEKRCTVRMVSGI
eukprot:7975950-Pyramimonas_sp.AAC.1